MSDDRIVVATTAQLANLEQLAETAKAYAAASVSPATKRGYESDWKGFRRWCAVNGLASLPASPQTVAMFVTHLANEGKSYHTIVRIMAAIRWVHDQRRLEHPGRDPAVRTIMRGIARTIGCGRRRQKAAATVEDVLAAMVAGLGDHPRDVRDRAVILLGFSGAFRRSELAAIRIEDVTIRAEGAVVHLRRSKTDQAGAGADVAIPRGNMPWLCPVRALLDWLELLKQAGITDGEVVRGIHASGRVLRGGHTDRTVCRIVQKAASRAGLDPKAFGAHSLRAGLATQAALRGKNIMQIAGHGRWKRVETVLGYFRAGTRFADNAAQGIGL